jgi:hypothetical protein
MEGSSMKTGYKTSKAPYEDIHFGDIVEYYEGSGFTKIVWRPFRVMMKPEMAKPYPILKIDRIIYRKAKRIDNTNKDGAE